MSEKAILVLDEMPTSCYDCPLDYDCLNGCTGYDYKELDTDDEILVQSRDYRPKLCPLKPLPRLEDNDDVDRMMVKHSAFIHMTMNKHAMLRFIDGWESALDEIEGKGR